MPVTIKEVSSPKQLKEFIRFPHTLYKTCPQWVPSLDFDEKNTLDRRKNPAFEYCTAKYWLAYKDGQIAGRIAGIINNRFIEVWKRKFARFGWIDFIDDLEVSAALLSMAETWARENGMEGIQGPLGFTDFDKEGMLVEGFDERGTMACIYNYPYYPVHLEKYSYTKETDWMEFKIHLTVEAARKIERIATIVEKRNQLTVLRLKKAKDIIPHAKDIFRLLNDCYKDLFGFVPLTEKQMACYTKQYFSFIRPDFVQLIFDKEQKLAAFGLTLPSLAAALQKTKGRLFPFGFLHLLRALKKNDTADLLLIAIREDLQGKGVNAIIMREGYAAYERSNITTVEASPQLETNTRVLTLWEHFNARQNKRRRCYGKTF
jgi:GNAT superfamily N-acetyltransferase